MAAMEHQTRQQITAVQRGQLRCLLTIDSGMAALRSNNWHQLAPELIRLLLLAADRSTIGKTCAIAHALCIRTPRLAVLLSCHCSVCSASYSMKPMQHDVAPSAPFTFK